jgi:hypothetical protein
VKRIERRETENACLFFCLRHQLRLSGGPHFDSVKVRLKEGNFLRTAMEESFGENLEAQEWARSEGPNRIAQNRQSPQCQSTITACRPRSERQHRQK